MSMLRTQSLVKRYGGLTVTDSVSLNIVAGELHALIGPNGAGKTTLINQISGELPSDSGSVFFNGDDVTVFDIAERARRGLQRSYQITSVFVEFTVLENVMLAATGATGHGFEFWRPLLAQDTLARTARQALADTGLDREANTLADALSYGQRRQLELAMSLAGHPRFLLLDEPLAGMSTQESAHVIALLRRLKNQYTILLVEHDMDAVFALADRISVLVYGKIIFTGTPQEVRAHPEVKAVYLGNESA